MDKEFTWDNYSDYYAFLDQMKTSQKTYYVFYFSGIYTPPDSLASISGAIEGDRLPLTLSINEESIDFYYSSEHDFSQSDTLFKLKEFYGRLFDFRFSDDALHLKSDGSIIDPAGELYIPKMLYPVAFKNLTADGHIKSGTKINWTEDAGNKKGILIVIDYDPLSQSDPDIRINFPDDKLSGKVVADIGSYIFAKNDFKGFPQNADLGFSLERIAHTSFLDDKGDECSFANHEKSISGFTISIAE